jgi:hypothetical protein
MNDEKVDAVYDLLQAESRHWMKEHGATANGDDVKASGRELFRKVVGPFILDCHAIDRLREQEGNSVTIVCDNPDFNGLPNAAVEVCADWTDWKAERFTGESVSLALSAALDAMMKRRCWLPAMCGCPKCVEKLGPIHPGNVGKPRPSGQLPEISRLA